MRRSAIVHTIGRTCGLGVCPIPAAAGSGVCLGAFFERDGAHVVVALILSAMMMGAGLGCGPAPVYLNVLVQEGAKDAVSYDDRSWAAVLRENVEDGLVDYGHLVTHSEPLDDYRQILASVSPDTSPDLFATRQSRLCFYINAYNTGVLAAVVQAQVPQSVHSLRFGCLEYRYHILVGGRWLKLAEIREKAMSEADGDIRVVFALCDAAMGSPPLHDQPFRPEGLEEQLRAVAVKAMDNHHIVVVDHRHQTLNVATWLATRREELISYYKRQTGAGSATMLDVVLHFAGRVRRDWLNTAAGYPERMIPFNRALNRRHPPMARPRISTGYQPAGWHVRPRSGACFSPCGCSPRSMPA